jgi:NAD(P)-dependent dehydrogenase (short-subunit alcohol dehydrogenase family)
MDLGLAGKNAIVCAGSKGLGRAVAFALAREGVNLVMNARSQDLLAATAKEIRGETGVEIVPVAADIATEAGREAVLAACPNPDILINNAGGPPPGDFQTFMTEWQKLNSSVEALAALGAELRLRCRSLEGDPQVRSLLQDVTHQIDPELFDNFSPDQQRTALALIQTSFRQAIDLLENPERAPGWNYEDPVILDSQGQVSRLIVRSIETMAAQRPEFGATLKETGTFLDIGTGVGWLAIEAARTWPTLRVVGIGSWQPALDLAQQNLAKSELSE